MISNKLKSRFKTKHQTAYEAIRAVGMVIKKSHSAALSPKERITHTEAVAISSPISSICLPAGPKRINLIFGKFNKKILCEKMFSEITIKATKFAVSNNYELRIISRNNLPNPKHYTDFLKANNLVAPEKYSFYTDCSDRVSSPVRRLDVSDLDVFFSENELSKLKGWIDEQTN